MGMISNIVYMTGIIAGSMYSTNIIDKDLIMELINSAKVQYDSSPYIDAMVTSSNTFTVKESLLTRPIQMGNIDDWTAVEWIAKMLMTERVNPKDDAELRYIGATAINYALLKGQTIKDVCSNKKHYSGVCRPHNKNWMRQPKKIHLQVAYSLIEEYKKGIPDDVGEAFYFCNMDIVKELNPKAYRWFSTLDPIIADNGRPLVFHVKGHGTHSAFKCQKFETWKIHNPNAKITSNHLG